MDEATDTLPTGTLPTATTLRLRHWFSATPDRVFQAWTRPETLKQWWCPEGWQAGDIDLELRVGGPFRIEMRHIQSDRPATVSGHFLEILQGKRLVFTWRWDGAFPGMPPSEVTIEFHLHDGGTELRLWQAVPDLPYCTQHLCGWLAAFERISSVLKR